MITQVHHGRRGSALPVALVMTIMLAALGTFLFVPIRDLGELVKQDEAQAVAREAAGSAIDVAISLLRSGRLPATAGTEGISLPAVQGSVTVKVTPATSVDGTWLIESSVRTAGTRPTTLTVFAAVQLGEPGEGGIRPLSAFATGRTEAVVQAVAR